MPQTVPIAENITSLNEVQNRFNLRRTNDNQFFTEWFNSLPALTDQEQESLDRVKHRYLYHRADGPLPEGTIKMVVLSPLLELAGFYDAPFKIQTEAPVEIAIEDRDEILRGRMDALVVQEQFWILVIEAKRTVLNIDLAIPQILTYMMAPHPNRPTFGLITNGGSFLFLKLTQQGTLQYDLSSLFSLLPLRNELHDVLRVLKQIGGLITQV